MPAIIAEAPDFIQVFSNGQVKRFAPEISPPSTLSSNNNYKSKDITIDPSKLITARVFLPNVPEIESPSQLPILVYFHGGGFCIGSTTWLGYNVFLGDLSSKSNTIILSIDYRLAPENKLPIAYEDCYNALKWLSTNSEPWLEHADLSNVYLSGDSAGGNIAHNVMINVIECNISKIRIKGVVHIHPYFGSEKRTNLEMDEESASEVAMNDMFWKLSIPDGWDRDFWGCNFEKREVEWRLFPDVLVLVAGLDFLKERGLMYVEFLKRKGVKSVSLIEAEEESHVFHVWNPNSKATHLLHNQITDFIHKI